MSVQDTHPEYEEMAPDWVVSRDSYGGETRIKRKGTEYLPATEGHIADGQGRAGTKGDRAYEAYKTRAVYPDLYRKAIETAIGTMHRKPPVIELPPSMESLREEATKDGESLELLLRRINVHQLMTGRVGLLGDLEVRDGAAVPILTLYDALAGRNWNERADGTGLGLVVLDESANVMQPNLSWDEEERYLVLAMAGEQDDGALVYAGQGTTYAYAIAEEGRFDVAGLEFDAPTRQGITLDRLPFAFINGRDIVAKPDLPPFLGLAQLCLAVYRGEADYRHALFMQSQATLVLEGAIQREGEAPRVGAGSYIEVEIGGKVYFAEVSGSGLSEMRMSLQNDYTRAAQQGAQLVTGNSESTESGEALRLRISAATTSYPALAQAGAAGLEDVLRAMAPWFGANPESVVVTPNMDFENDVPEGRLMVEVQTAKNLGAKLSDKSIHALAQRQGFTEMTYEDELAEMENEEPALGALGTPGAGGFGVGSVVEPNGPEQEESDSATDESADDESGE